VPRLQDLDAIYFADRSWQERLDGWVAARTRDTSFLPANATAVEVISRRPDLGLRMAVNIPAHALLLFLRDDRYLNGYQRAAVLGVANGPSATRRTVDAALFDGDPAPEDHCFGAAVLGGPGVRYYGDYCLVLKEQVVPDTTQVLDRNSYDAVFPPLAECGPLDGIFATLRGNWGVDLRPIVKLKVLPGLGSAPRLATAATASELLLHDESFVEVHKRGSFMAADVHEVRESAADAAVEADLAGRRERGHALTPEETIWLQRRHAVDRALAERDIRSRIIVTSGRSPR
jgi:hypothetical protein